MLLLVTTVSALVHIYTIGYMQGEPGYARFFSYIASVHVLHADVGDGRQFSAALRLLGSRRPLFLFLDRPLVRTPSACAAATKAFIVNRVGDFGFILGLLFVLHTFGSLDYRRLRQCSRVGGKGHEHPWTVRGQSGTSRPHSHLPPTIHRRSRKIRPVAAPCLAAGRHGRPDADLGAHSRCDDGHRWGLHGRPIAPLYNRRRPP